MRRKLGLAVFICLCATLSRGQHWKLFDPEKVYHYLVTEGDTNYVASFFQISPTNNGSEINRFYAPTDQDLRNRFTIKRLFPEKIDYLEDLWVLSWKGDVHIPSKMNKNAWSVNDSDSALIKVMSRSSVFRNGIQDSVIQLKSSMFELQLSQEYGIQEVTDTCCTLKLIGIQDDWGYQKNNWTDYLPYAKNDTLYYLASGYDGNHDYNDLYRIVFKDALEGKSTRMYSCEFSKSKGEKFLNGEWVPTEPESYIKNISFDSISITQSICANYLINTTGKFHGFFVDDRPKDLGLFQRTIVPEGDSSKLLIDRTYYDWKGNRLIMGDPPPNFTGFTLQHEGAPMEEYTVSPNQGSIDGLGTQARYVLLGGYLKGAHFGTVFPNDTFIANQPEKPALQIDVFPNPVRRQFDIEIIAFNQSQTPWTLEIVELGSGRKIRTMSIEEKLTRIDTKVLGLTTGLYCMEFQFYVNGELNTLRKLLVVVED